MNTRNTSRKENKQEKKKTFSGQTLTWRRCCGRADWRDWWLGFSDARFASLTLQDFINSCWEMYENIFCQPSQTSQPLFLNQIKPMSVQWK